MSMPGINHSLLMPTMVTSDPNPSPAVMTSSSSPAASVSFPPAPTHLDLHRAAATAAQHSADDSLGPVSAATMPIPVGSPPSGVSEAAAAIASAGGMVPPMMSGQLVPMVLVASGQMSAPPAVTSAPVAILNAGTAVPHAGVVGMVGVGGMGAIIGMDVVGVPGAAALSVGSKCAVADCIAPVSMCVCVLWGGARLRGIVDACKLVFYVEPSAFRVGISCRAYPRNCLVHEAVCSDLCHALLARPSVFPVFHLPSASFDRLIERVHEIHPTIHPNPSSSSAIALLSLNS